MFITVGPPLDFLPIPPAMKQVSLKQFNCCDLGGGVVHLIRGRAHILYVFRGHVLRIVRSIRITRNTLIIQYNLDESVTVLDNVKFQYVVEVFQYIVAQTAMILISPYPN